MREGAARDEWWTAHVNTHENPADSLTEPLPAGEQNGVTPCSKDSERRSEESGP